MDSLDNYRAKIGSFYHCATGRRRHKKKAEDPRSYKYGAGRKVKSSLISNFSLVTSLLLLFAFSFLSWISYTYGSDLSTCSFHEQVTCMALSCASYALMGKVVRLWARYLYGPGRRIILSTVSKLVFAISLLLLLAFSALSLYVTTIDPGVETNPGPKREELLPKVRGLFIQFKNQRRALARVASHRYFLCRCNSLGVIPKGLDLKVSLSAVRGTEKLQRDIKQITSVGSQAIVTTLIDHYDRLFAQMQHTIDEESGNLKRLCGESCFSQQCAVIDADFKKYLQSLQTGKEKKLSSYISADKANNETWIPVLGLKATDRNFIVNNKKLSDQAIASAMSLLCRENPLMVIQSIALPTVFLEYSPFETLHIHHTGSDHFVTSSSIGGTVRLFDSKNYQPTEELLDQIRAIYSPDDSLPTLFQCHMVHEQSGGVDCGLFAIAYAFDLFLGFDPTTVFFDQSKMRDHLMLCFSSRTVTRFPIHRETDTPAPPAIEITRDIPATEKWVTPKKTAPKDTTRKPNTEIELQNSFLPLSTLSEEQNNTQPDIEILPPLGSDDHTHPDTDSANRHEESPLPPDRPDIRATHTDYSTRSLGIKNLTRDPFRPLTKEECEVLELGLTFSPSKGNFNKESITEGLYWFARKLKLKEYFFQRTTATESPVSENNQSSWEPNNPDWYPQEVKNGASPSLTSFITGTLSDLRTHLNKNHSYHSNLDQKKRDALRSLSSDTSIVIKQSDKCGNIVIMSRTDYEKACLDQLCDSSFYEEVDHDPNIEYHHKVIQRCAQLEQNGHISRRQLAFLTEECKTPTLYGRPKLHKNYTNFPALRPICSGVSSPTARLSQFIDTILKPIAQTTTSYIRDTTHFILKTRDFKLNRDAEKTFLVTMDVSSLYPNIDHTEGIQACHNLLSRSSSQIPTETVTDLINLVLTSNTMGFLNRFFHQIKGTAMGTAMAVNYANIFMANFESNLLRAYTEKTGKQPALWLRFIDDIFFVWQGDEGSLKEFLAFCNSYAKSNNMKSNISFTYAYSEKSVNFLDTVVSLEADGTISTDLFTKPTAAYQYLHQSSYHDPHLIKAVPKSQFIRIRRICSTLDQYWSHANNFIKHFQKRGYNLNRLRDTATEISAIHRDQLLLPKEKQSNDRIPLIIPYHHHLGKLSKILHDNYRKMVTETPAMKRVFPAPPMVAFKRNKNLSDTLIQAKHWLRSKHQSPNQEGRDRTRIKHQMNKSGKLCNPKNGRSCAVAGGKPTDKGVIYAVKCKKHNVIYVGATTDHLNQRMNRHRSDISHYPERCELPRHFSDNDCCFDRDAEISILEHAKGNIRKLERIEDKWVTRLGTLQPNGLNIGKSEYGKIYSALFR